VLWENQNDLGGALAVGSRRSDSRHLSAVTLTDQRSIGTRHPAIN
jgi:hypothetical protein